MENDELCAKIAKIAPKIRFSGLINHRGRLIAGGMVTKVEAAKLVTSAGIGMLLTKLSDLPDALAGKQVGTYFLPN